MKTPPRPPAASGCFASAAGRLISTSLLLAASGGCAIDQRGADETVLSTEEDELFVAREKIWKDLAIPVCFEKAVMDTVPPERRQWVRDAVTGSLQQKSRLKFSGWGQCVTGAAGIHVGKTLKPTDASSSLVGRSISKVTDGLRLNFEDGRCKLPNGTTFPLEACVKFDAVHEFGHALGFDHEQDRPDGQVLGVPLCPFLTPGNEADTMVGTYDILSIMSYCKPTADPFLSDLDLIGLHFFYGDPNSGSMKKDAVVWQGSDAAYFFMGNRYTKFGFTAPGDHVQDFYPRTLDSSTWPGWPTGAPWSQGVDAALDYGNGSAYLFSGNQYLKYDKAGDRVSQAPKTLPGGWKNWPKTWTSAPTAAVRWTNGKVYMFRGDEYLRISSGVTVDPDYPRPIEGNWDIPSPFTSGIDYVLLWSNNKAYFFRGTKYVRMDLTTELTDGGPSLIVGRWPGVPF
jgi:hypothetical protein